jgi:hypothetical protein
MMWPVMEPADLIERVVILGSAADDRGAPA